MNTPDTNLLISAYFEKLNYPAIKEISPCLFHPQGDVYLVKFEKKLDSHLGSLPKGAQVEIQRDPVPEDHPTVAIEIPNAYAIVIGEKVVGYHEEFWVDADRYRLVLKQHLGLLAMEAAEKAPSTPTNAVEAAPKPPALEGHVRTETVDAIVTRYEEMLLKASMEMDQTAQAAMQREAELTQQLTDAQTELIAARIKLETILAVMDGKGTEEVQPPSPVACMTDQGGLGPYDSDSAAAEVGAYGDNGAYPVSMSPGPPVVYRNGQAAQRVQSFGEMEAAAIKATLSQE